MPAPPLQSLPAMVNAVFILFFSFLFSALFSIAA